MAFEGSETFAFGFQAVQEKAPNASGVYTIRSAAELGLSARTREGHCSNADWLRAVWHIDYTAFNRLPVLRRHQAALDTPSTQA